MAILTTGNTFADGDQVTSTKLNDIANAATFASGAVDDSTTQLSSGAIIVKDLGISAGKIATSAVTTAKLATNSVSTAKIIDGNVTKAKIENFTNLTVLGNVSGGAATPAEVTIIDDDTMGTASATALATSESIKAYVDTQIGDNNDLSEILANGNTTGANNIIVTAGQAITTDTVSETTAAAGVTVDSLLIKDGGITAAGTSTFAGQTISDLGTVTTANIDGGSIDGTTVGASSASTGAFTTLTASDDVNFDSGTLFVDASVNSVGIGTASPQALLEVGDAESSSAVTDGNLIVKTTSTNDTAIVIQENSGSEQWGIGVNVDGDLAFTNSGNAASIVFDDSNNVGIGTTSPGTIFDINDDAAIGTGLRVTGGGGGGPLATFTRDVGSTGSVTIGAASGDPQIRFTSAGDTWSVGLDSTVFNICDGSAVGANQRLVIDTAGNVGIGTTSPEAELHVQGPVGAGGEIYLTDGDDTGGSNSLLIQQSGGTSYIRNRKSTGPLYLGAGDGNHLNILSSGNVGIGTTSPSYKLDVNGTGRFTSTVRFDGQTQNYNGAYDINRSGAGYVRHRIADQTLSLGVTNTAGTVHYPIVMAAASDVLIFNNEEGEMARFDTSGNLGCF
jgi:hypothetical protein